MLFKKMNYKDYLIIEEYYGMKKELKKLKFNNWNKMYYIIKINIINYII